MRVFRMMALVLVALAGAACADLEVENLNDPDRDRAITTPGDVEALISGSFEPWWRSNFHYFYSSAPAMSVMADDHTATWGNFGMNDSSREPREPINNDPSYGYSYIVEQAWTQSYRALSGIRDGLISIEGGTEIGGGDDTHRAVTFARLMQGLVHGTLALQYDQAFILDETVDPEQAQLQPYQDVANAAIGYLQEAVTLAGQEDFDVPATWMGNIDGHDAAFIARLAHTYIARIMANTPRSVAERDAVDWGLVLQHLDAGITEDFTVDGNHMGCCDALKSYAGTYSGWARWDMRSIGPADQSGNFQAWIDTPLADRNAFLIDTDDRRITSAGHFASPARGDQGLYVEFRGINSSPWPAARGTYNYSDYRDYRYDYYSDEITGIIPVFSFAEVEFLRAEAMFRTGNQAGALAIVNERRVENGELPPATLLGDQSARCVPRNPDGTCGDLWEVLKYEKRIETFHDNWATAYFDDRGWGDLVTNTAVHFPVPGNELLLLLEDIYTFGGGGEGSAPDTAVTDFSGYNLTPEVLHARRMALEAFDAQADMLDPGFAAH